MTDSFTTTCKDFGNRKGCGKEILMAKDSDGKWHPCNIDGSKHEHPKAGTPTVGGSTGGNRPTKQTRWEGIKEVKEIRYGQVNEYLLNGWVVLDRIERVLFVQQGTELKEGSESVYVVGLRA